ncbi:urotensin-2 [Pteronotus mesoamericanus]|uniref:urotensin-2 n=1 Tax=Pteronotus mesoamericanus TaxID=1884717 RepID=UPI0023EC1224|nr:urotensin-2 [Pteronotus parnellii mesoamericanus]
MYKLASCCLLFMGCLNALFSLPVPGSREEPLLFSDPDTNVFNPRGITRKALSGQEPNILLNHLLATIRKQFKKRGHPSECFWKYCV